MRTSLLLALSLLVVPAAAHAADQTVVSHWTQYGAGGTIELRAVVDGASCPAIVVDGVQQATPMQDRAVPDANFAVHVCSQILPAGAETASILGLPVAMPVADPQRILVLGDTGCRIKGTAVQACNDPKAWPFAIVSAAAARLKPDLVLHLGDYLYRESPCPPGNAGCAGSPFGDNWASWNADFFTPAAPLLAAAPWIIVRGNHEDCSRSGPGFLRLLGPIAFDPAAPCIDHLAPYAVTVDNGQTVVVMDNASASDTSVDDKMVPVYAADYAALKAVADTGAGRQLWLAAHRPIWAAITGPLGLPIGGSATLIAATGDLSAFQSVSLMLSGHIHSFEAINYKAKIPPQIVAGHGGDNLDVTPVNLGAAVFQGNSGVHVKDGLSVRGFGFLMMTKVAGGWSIQLYDSDGTPEIRCQFADARVTCPKPR